MKNSKYLIIKLIHQVHLMTKFSSILCSVGKFWQNTAVAMLKQESFPLEGIPAVFTGGVQLGS